MKNINRRNFIKGSSLMGMAGVLSTNVMGQVLSGNSQLREKTLDSEIDVSCEFNYNDKGTFKILQFADTHYISGDPRSERALMNINEMLDIEKPDLVIHTGDAIYGKPAEKSIREIFDPLSRRKIPFALTFGNHDDEFDKTREELFDIIKSIPYNVSNTIAGISGVTNSILTITSLKHKRTEHVLYLFDSNSYSTIKGIKGYGHIHFDQIEWYRKNSQRFTEKNDGIPIPSVAFFHIPIPEYEMAATKGNVFMKGTRGERVCCPEVNSGLFVSMKEMGDIKATFVGHDHNNDFVACWNEIFLFYGRFSGCDTVYNDVKPAGARVIEFSEGKGGFCSWIRLYGGDVIQKHQYPNDFSWKKA